MADQKLDKAALGFSETGLQLVGLFLPQKGEVGGGFSFMLHGA